MVNKTLGSAGKAEEEGADGQQHAGGTSKGDVQEVMMADAMRNLKTTCGGAGLPRPHDPHTDVIYIKLSRADKWGKGRMEGRMGTAYHTAKADTSPMKHNVCPVRGGSRGRLCIQRPHVPTQGPLCPKPPFG